MKKAFFILSFILLVLSVNASVWIVDNNVNSPQPIKDIQDAIDNYASAGDTIMVEGSPNKYGAFVITKPLTIIGEGSNDQSGENTLSGLITIRASNVLITGFNLILGGVTGITFDIVGAGGSLSNIIVERCETTLSFYNFQGSSASLHDINIRNNAIRYGINATYGGSYAINVDTLIFENNIFSEINFNGWGSWITGVNTVLIRNNVFINASAAIFYNSYWGSNLTDAIISNNIFDGANPQGCNNCTFLNNLTYGNGVNDTLPGPQNNNIYSQDPLFVNYSGGGFNYSYDFALQTGSPAIASGVGGTDMGIKGGYYPYVVGAGSKIPVVDFVNLSSSAVPENKQVNLQFDAHIRK